MAIDLKAQELQIKLELLALPFLTELDKTQKKARKLTLQQNLLINKDEQRKEEEAKKASKDRLKTARMETRIMKEYRDEQARDRERNRKEQEREPGDETTKAPEVERKDGSPDDPPSHSRPTLVLSDLTETTSADLPCCNGSSPAISG